MRNYLFPILVCLMFLGRAQELHTRTLLLMGSRFDLTIVAANSTKGQEVLSKAVAEITRVEALISSWKETSETSKINAQAGKAPVVVSGELYDLIQRAISLSKLTDGAFDISYAALDPVWRFDGSMKKIPAPVLVKESVRYIDYSRIVLDPKRQTVFLPTAGMKIGFGAIGKGYAADKAKALLVSLGVQGGIINAGGDMASWGRKPDGRPWEVAITNPMRKDLAFARLPLENGAVVTSGDYEKFVEIAGKRYSHIIDPRTGYPSSGIRSVTVFAPRAELADALATAVFVMGVGPGMDRLAQLPGVGCIIIDSEGSMHTSDSIKLKRI